MPNKLLPKMDARVTRQHVTKLSSWVRPYETEISDINDALKTLYLVDDHEILMEKMIDRYAQVLIRKKNTSGEASDVFYPSREVAKQAAFVYGQYEVHRANQLNSICKARATLFSEPKLSYSYVKTGDSKKIDEDLQVEMAQLRTEGGVNLARQRWDVVSCGIHSCLNYVSIQGDKLIERDVSPAAVWVVYGTSVEQAGKMRPVNERDIDDASLIVMQLTDKDNANKCHYAAWFGPSDKPSYEYGRFVQYQANGWSEIPDPDENDKEIVDYRTPAGELANPLSFYAATKNKWAGPTYPFSIAYGDLMSGGLIPVSTSLFKNSQEIDIGTSIVLGASLRGSMGTRVFDFDDSGMQSPIPPTADGTVIAEPGMTLEFKGWPVSHSKDAMEILKELSRMTSESVGVPGFMVASTGSERPSSGREVIARSGPLIKDRHGRIQSNRASVARLFSIQRALINSVNGTEVIAQDTKEVWDPGSLDVMMDPMEDLEVAKAKKELGIATIATVFKDLDNLDSEDEALNKLAERQELMDKNVRPLPAGAAAPVKPAAPGLPRGFK